jgi:XTP/dITP diphosphohydrolase
MDLLVATRSAHKMREIRQLLGDVPDLRLLDLDEAGITYDEAEKSLEPYDSFEENARSKAEYFHARSGLPTVADDSGLAVDALNGAPGVRSKRFFPGRDLEGLAQDEANNRYLMQCLAHQGAGERGARFVCVAALVGVPGEPVMFRGEAPGEILTEPRGAGGFGYDPLFLDPELGLTFAEIDGNEKNARSHRGKAFRALARALAVEG